MMPSSCSGDEAHCSSELKTTAAIKLGNETLLLRKPQRSQKLFRVYAAAPKRCFPLAGSRV